MKKLLILFCCFFSIVPLIAQLPGQPSNPMTANGARQINPANNINFAHKLFWNNPGNATYNEVYFSADSNHVINLAPSAKILSGFDSTIVYDSLSLELIGFLNMFTKYYWRVIEYNSFGQTAGPVWYFISGGPVFNYWDDHFNDGLSNYILIEPPGASWAISNTSYAGGGSSSPELKFSNSLTFNDTAYLILDSFFNLSYSQNAVTFFNSIDWLAGEFTVGVAYSLDEGISWIPIWQQVVTEDIPSNSALVFVPTENYVKLALYCISTNPNSAGYWYVDDLRLISPLTLPSPPKQLRATADSLSLKVSLSWDPGYTVNPSWGYAIQRKDGLPGSVSDYQEIALVGPNIFIYEDTDVQLDKNYTYRIQTCEGPGGGTRSIWSNEATAYVPEVVPVELVSLNFEVNNNNVHLTWITATEINNQGFEIQRQAGSKQNATGNGPDGGVNWDVIGFVGGNGTTTEINYYSFVDEGLLPGKYFYRLKQIDFDGSYEFSSEIEVDVGIPDKFYLFQNYPNPFNPGTTISWQSHVHSFQTLKVYDLLGREVATLVNEERPVGYYEVQFDASSATGGLTSGVYFYQLRAGDFIDTKKFLLLK